MDRYQTAIEEIALSGSIALGDCSLATVRRWAKVLNERMVREKYDWRVRANIYDRTLTQISVEEYDAGRK